MSYYTLITIVVCHFVFDFFLQTSEMSKNKSSSNEALSRHVMVYSAGLLQMVMLNFSLISEWGFLFIIINGAAHFITDWVTSRASSALYKEERYHEFFTVIGVDQMVHYITLFGTFIWLSNL